MIYVFATGDLIYKEPFNWMGESIDVLKQLALKKGDLNNNIQLLVGGLTDGIPNENSRRLYTKDLIVVDTPLLVTVDEGWTLIIVSYDENNNWISNSGQRDGPYRRVFKPIQYLRFIIMVNDNGSHPQLTSDQIKDALNHVHFYKVGALVEESLKGDQLNWISLSMFYKIGVIGDSYASGSLHHPDGSGWTSNYNLSWPQILGRSIGATVTNFTKGGLSTKTWLTDTDYGLSKLLSTPKQQLYIIALGINDESQITEGTLTLGTVNDLHENYTQNPDTFYGNYGRIIGNIQSYAPNAKIVLLSVARYAERIIDEHIKTIAEYYELPFIYLPDDVYFISEEYYQSIYDGHPISYGYGGMAEAIKRLLIKSILNNEEYFKTYYGIDT